MKRYFKKILAGESLPSSGTDTVCFLASSFYRAMLCISGTNHGPVSVCPSVRPSQVGVLLKWLNVKSHKQHHTIVKGL